MILVPVTLGGLARVSVFKRGAAGSGAAAVPAWSSACPGPPTLASGGDMQINPAPSWIEELTPEWKGSVSRPAGRACRTPSSRGCTRPRPSRPGGRYGRGLPTPVRRRVVPDPSRYRDRGPGSDRGLLPAPADFDQVVVRAGATEGHTAADRQNSLVIDSLGAGDVMVTDIFGKIENGTKT